MDLATTGSNDTLWPPVILKFREFFRLFAQNKGLCLKAIVDFTHPIPSKLSYVLRKNFMRFSSILIQ